MKTIVGMSEETYRHIKNNLYRFDLDMERGIIINRNIEKVDEWGYYPAMIAGKRRRVHQILAVARWGDACIGMTVNHINGIKTDNSWNNLELITNEKNASLNNGGGTGKPIKAINIQTGDESVFESTWAACKSLGLHQTSVRRVLDGKYPHIKGFTFERIPA